MFNVLTNKKMYKGMRKKCYHDWLHKIHSLLVSAFENMYWQMLQTLGKRSVLVFSSGFHPRIPFYWDDILSRPPTYEKDEFSLGTSYMYYSLFSTL